MTDATALPHKIDEYDKLISDNITNSPAAIVCFLFDEVVWFGMNSLQLQ